MKRLGLSLAILLCLCVPAFSATTLVKAISLTQIAIGEKPSAFYLNLNDKIGVMQTTLALYIISDAINATTGYYSIEKVALPTFETNEVIKTLHWNTATNKPIALETNKNIYFFLYN